MKILLIFIYIKTVQPLHNSIVQTDFNLWTDAIFYNLNAMKRKGSTTAKTKRNNIKHTIKNIDNDQAYYIIRTRSSYMYIGKINLHF